MLSIKLMGKAEIVLNKMDITEKFGAKTFALLSLLLLNEQKHLNREKIITYLWPDSNENSGKYNLRFNLWLIKNLIKKDKKGNNFLYVERGHCSINKDYEFNCDIIDIKYSELKKINSIEELENLKNKFSGDFLEGFYFRNCDEFNNTIISERNYFENLKIKILLKLVTLYENNKRFEECSKILTELIKLEPYDEDIALRIMEIYENWGKRSSAIIFYDSFKNRIMTYLGIQPSELLKEKYIKLKREESIFHKETLLDENIKSKSEETEIMKITICCIGEIKYYWMSTFLEKLVKEKNIIFKDYLTPKQEVDLSYITEDWKNELLDFSPPDIRIVKSFLMLIKKISEEYSIVIKVENQEKIDEISRYVLDYLLVNNLIKIE